MRQAVEWGQRVWNKVSATTFPNCWRKVEILPREVQLLRVGLLDCVMQELAELQASFVETSGDPLLEPQDITDDPLDWCTGAPQEDNAQDSELEAALQERYEEDEEEADKSVELVPMTLAEDKKAREAVRIFLQENQTEHSELLDFMGGFESLSRVIERMSFSA